MNFYLVPMSEMCLKTSKKIANVNLLLDGRLPLGQCVDLRVHRQIHTHQCMIFSSFHLYSLISNTPVSVSIAELYLISITACLHACFCVCVFVCDCKAILSLLCLIPSAFYTLWISLILWVLWISYLIYGCCSLTSENCC